MFEFVLPFIILIIVVVFVHEYGHYYFARRYGVGVTDFSIGFGKELFGWNDKSGTRWKVCWIPLGGYVKFFGDRNVFSQADRDEILKKYNEKDREKLFTLKPLYQRAWIVFGGPLANFILAIFIFLMINILNSLSPAKVDLVRLVDTEGQHAHVLVPPDQLSLAIGREGQNVRLAARLTGWKIDVKNSHEYDQEAEDAAVSELIIQREDEENLQREAELRLEAEQAERAAEDARLRELYPLPEDDDEYGQETYEEETFSDGDQLENIQDSEISAKEERKR